MHSDLLKGMSHITGGGFIENVPRVLPKGTGCWIDAAQWSLPPVFGWLMRQGGVEPLEMCRTFNCGVGMVVVVSREKAEEAVEMLRKSGEEVVWRIGEVTGAPGVEMRGLEGWKA